MKFITNLYQIALEAVCKGSKRWNLDGVDGDVARDVTGVLDSLGPLTNVSHTDIVERRQMRALCADLILKIRRHIVSGLLVDLYEESAYGVRQLRKRVSRLVFDPFFDDKDVYDKLEDAESSSWYEFEMSLLENETASEDEECDETVS